MQTTDGLVHRVLVGNHLGQADGRVIAVTDSEISFVEIISDGLGGYLERPAKIARPPASKRAQGSLGSESYAQVRPFERADLIVARPLAAAAAWALALALSMSAARAQDCGSRRSTCSLCRASRCELRLRTNGTAPEPMAFTIENPARISIDLPNTALALANRAAT